MAGPPATQNCGRNQNATQPRATYSTVENQRGALRQTRHLTMPSSAPPHTMPSTAAAIPVLSSATDRGV